MRQASEQHDEDLDPEGSGFILFWKQLEHGAFMCPPVMDGVFDGVNTC